MQVIRAVKRYNESAKIEAEILQKIQEKGGSKHGIVYLKEYFIHTDSEGEHMCLVFETLGKSLYDFIKENKYKGMNSYRKSTKMIALDASKCAYLIFYEASIQSNKA